MSSPQRKKILVIDDEEDIREVIKMSLEGLTEWEIITASSGKEGLLKAQTESPSAILLDVMMPGMDGPATLAQLKSRVDTKNIPVFLLTAKVRSQEVKQFSDLDIAAVISKPFDPMTLHLSIAKCLDWQVAETQV